MAFLPRPDQTIDFKGRSFRFVQHKAAKDPMVHAETGARATVFLAMNGSESWALKVFRPKFRKQHQAEVVQRLVGLRGMAGLRVAERDVVLPDDPLVAAHKDLAFAQVMPWVAGVPWANILAFGVQKNQCYLDPAYAFELCRRFLSTMHELERRTIAHTDIASGNVLVDPETLSVELIDLEEMYGPGFPEPGQRNVGSAGYTHPAALLSGQGLWFPEADRFATTILAAEMLVLAHPQLALSADTGGGYFDNAEFGRRSGRFEAAYDYFTHVLPDFAEVFSRAWMSQSLQACPRAADLVAAFAHGISALPKPSGPALVPVHQSASWTPPVTTRRTTSQPSPQSTRPASASTPPASSSTPPTADPDVVVGWNRLGATPPRAEPQRAAIRNPVQLNIAQSTLPMTPAQAQALAPMRSPVMILFTHSLFSVRHDSVWLGSSSMAQNQIVSVSVARKLGLQDRLLLATLVASASVAFYCYFLHWQPQVFGFVTLLGVLALFTLLALGVGKPTLMVRGVASQQWEVPMETAAIAEDAARSVRKIMAPPQHA